MAIKIRNRNKYAYNIKLALKEFIYKHIFILRQYLKLKEFFIRHSGILADKNDALFDKIFIETISYCNNDCAFCPASAKTGAKGPGNFMAEGLYIKILNELADLSFKGSVAFHCNNEPLLDERLLAWVRRARGFLKSNYFYLYTNGILIDIKIANQLFAAGLNRIIVNNYNDKYKLIPSIKGLVANSSIAKGEVVVNLRKKK